MVIGKNNSVIQRQSGESSSFSHPQTIRGRGRIVTTHRSGLLTTEMLVALAIVGIAILPLAYSFAQENRYLRRCYERSVAIEIVDGEMEIIRAGGWRQFTNGVHTLTTTAHSATNLPPGELRLTLTDKQARVEWLPTKTAHGSPVVREATLK